MCHPLQRDDYYLAQLLCNANKNLEARDVLRIGLQFHVTFLHESEEARRWHTVLTVPL